MAEITTIKLEKETKERLSRLKEHEKESFEQVIKKILHILNVCKKNPIAANKMIHNIDFLIKKKQAESKEIQESEEQENSKPRYTKNKAKNN